MKDAQFTLQKTITWTKKSNKREARMGSSLPKNKFASKKVENLCETKFVSKVVFYQETLEYADTITMCYSHQSLHFV